MSITDPNKSKIDRLRELKQLYEDGTINEAEMNAEKAIILSQDETSADQAHQKKKQSGKLQINSNGKTKWILVAVGVIIIAIVVWLLVKPTDNSNPIESGTTEAEALWPEQEMVEIYDDDAPEDEIVEEGEILSPEPEVMEVEVEEGADTYKTATKKSAFDKDGICTSPDVAAKFPGGESAMYEWVYTHLKSLSFTEAKVVVQLLIDKKGKIKNVQLVRGCGDKAIDNDVIATVKGFPDFKPASYNGNAVDSYFVIPFRLKIK